ncbi:MAG: hypothetical protein LBO72_11015 [Helicobacteraceae bacterium]|jgi:hypothetical protein|nr:hypothetical protein [Helicobacteraceae bacterium]
MKSLFFAIFALILSTAACAAESPPAVRVYRDHFACARETWLRDTFEFAAKSDRVSMASYLAMKRCFRTLDARAYILTIKSDAAQILARGRKIWVPSAAVKLD